MKPSNQVESARHYLAYIGIGLLWGLLIFGIVMFAFGLKQEIVSKHTSNCISGYKFYQGTQIFDEHGKGIPCDREESK